jgi:hypothetical protein
MRQLNIMFFKTFFYFCYVIDIKMPQEWREKQAIFVLFSLLHHNLASACLSLEIKLCLLFTISTKKKAKKNHNLSRKDYVETVFQSHESKNGVSTNFQ